MKVAILAGGQGTRLAEETRSRPKPMVEIGGQPILWHILKHYAHHGFDDFVVALGHRGDSIKRHFGSLAGAAAGSANGEPCDPDHRWRIDLVDTGEATLTGGRVKRLRDHLGDGTFMLTWGDGLSDVNIGDLLAFHRAHGKLATVTAVHPPPRFGHLDLDGDRVSAFREKPKRSEGWINGAFFVLEPGVLDYIEGDAVMFEHAPMEHLSRDGELMAYRHEGFWAAVDTIHDKARLQDMWDSGVRPWATWGD